jgi:uncharacterized protein YndB with AHSA1/START domain/ketosteroid isomerase-like protein
MADRIVKSVVLQAPPHSVWPALADAKAFGTWFGAEFDGSFTPGAHLTGRITPTQVDPEVARAQEPYKGMPIDLTIDRIDPVRLFSFRWHPYAADRSVDYSKEPPTLVEFELEKEGEGTRLTVTESGFDQLPAARRAKAFEANAGGWEKQMELVRNFVGGETTIEKLVRACFAAYVAKDREAIEALLADDFHFTSPLDNRIDRATYFEVCWPNSERMDGFDIERICVEGDRAFVTYEGRMGNERFRNTEVHTVRGNKIADVEVYFGWSVPHPVKPGRHKG